ncbi:GspH/FimT family pseudopilin [Dyella terrae]|nr:GspH/FimT family pseudopilin [Dyella terrae]
MNRVLVGSFASRWRVPRGRHVPVRREQGFTLVEMVITLVVAAILIAVAVPSFSNMINTNRLTTATNAMVGALNTARMEAIKRNGSVQFCSNTATTNTSGTGDTLGTACSTSTGAVVALTGATTATVLAPPAELSIPSVKVRNTVAAIRFNGSGLGYAPGAAAPFGTGATGSVVVELCSTALKTANDIQVNMITGSIITSSTPSNATSCP